MYAIPNGTIKIFMEVEHTIENTIVLNPTYDDNVMCWNKLCTAVAPKTLNRTNITKLMMVMDKK